jgi:membrane-associated phospholipid phosphatase
LRRKGIKIHGSLLLGVLIAASSAPAPCQTTFVAPILTSTSSSIAITNLPGIQLQNLRVDSLTLNSLPMNSFPEDGNAPNASQDSSTHHGFVRRMVKRGLEDQGRLYAAPFKPSNLKWDAIVLLGIGALIATDRRIEKHLPDGHFQTYQNSSNAAIAGLASSLAGLWIYGIKTDNPHAKETGELELETLTNTFLIYTPMQLIAGRQRPGEGNGNGDFWRHHALNTSFPGGHAMFTWSMATVVAHEYPKPWVKVLAYGAALTVTAGRYLARDHWSSDMFVGPALGFAIGTNIFHSRCNPDLSGSCHHPF